MLVAPSTVQNATRLLGSDIVLAKPRSATRGTAIAGLFRVEPDGLGAVSGVFNWSQPTWGTWDNDALASEVAPLARASPRLNF